MSLLAEASCRTASQIRSKSEWPASHNTWLVSGDAKRPRDGSRRRVRCLGLAHSQGDYEVTKASTRSFHHMRQRSQGANRRRELHRLASVPLFFEFRSALVQVRYCRTRAGREGGGKACLVFGLSDESNELFSRLLLRR